MKRITINNKEYTIEYNIEASLYDDCTKSVMDIFVKAGMSENYAKKGDAQSAMNEIVGSITSLPQRVVTLFYAGLLEHHGKTGDHSVKSKEEAKNLAAMYLKATKKSWANLNNDLMECIAEDNFFELIGLDEILKPMEEERPKRGRKKNEDGKNTFVN